MDQAIQSFRVVSPHQLPHVPTKHALFVRLVNKIFKDETNGHLKFSNSIWNRLKMDLFLYFTCSLMILVFSMEMCLSDFEK